MTIKNFALSSFSAIAIAVATIGTSFAGPIEGFEFEGIVLSNESEVEYIETYGDGYPTYITLDGYCPRPTQDIDLWVYYNDKLIAKATDRGCFHNIQITTPYDMHATIKVVVENSKKPFDTSFTLLVE